MEKEKPLSASTSALPGCVVGRSNSSSPELGHRSLSESCLPEVAFISTESCLISLAATWFDTIVSQSLTTGGICKEISSTSPKKKKKKKKKPAVIAPIPEAAQSGGSQPGVQPCVQPVILADLKTLVNYDAQKPITDYLLRLQLLATGLQLQSEIWELYNEYNEAILREVKAKQARYAFGRLEHVKNDVYKFIYNFHLDSLDAIGYALTHIKFLLGESATEKDRRMAVDFLLLQEDKDMRLLADLIMNEINLSSAAQDVAKTKAVFEETLTKVAYYNLFYLEKHDFLKRNLSYIVLMIDHIHRVIKEVSEISEEHGRAIDDMQLKVAAQSEELIKKYSAAEPQLNSLYQQIVKEISTTTANEQQKIKARKPLDRDAYRTMLDYNRELIVNPEGVLSKGKIFPEQLYGIQKEKQLKAVSRESSPKQSPTQRKQKQKQTSRSISPTKGAREPVLHRERSKSIEPIVVVHETEFKKRYFADKSYIDSEDETSYTIIDPKNKVRIVLYKTDLLHKPTVQLAEQKPYTQAINEWFANPQAMLENQGYLDPSNPKFKFRNNAKFAHSFALAVDNFINQLGKQTTTHSRIVPNKMDILITIPGVIYYDSKSEPGLFTYIIDSQNGQWYHRLFVARTGQQLLTEYLQKGFYEIEFPPLSTDYE